MVSTDSPSTLGPSFSLTKLLRAPLASRARQFLYAGGATPADFATPEGEPAYRVNLCDGCRKYIKGIDAREVSHLVYAPLEQISSLHLDIKATEQGYQSGIPMALPE